MLALTSAYTPWVHLADANPRGPWSVVNRVLAHYLLVVNYEGIEQLVVEGKPYEISDGISYLIQPGVFVEHIGSKRGSRPGYVHFDVIFNARRAEHGNTLSNAASLEGRQHLLQPVAKEVWGVDLPLFVPKALQPMVHSALEPIIKRWRTGHPHEHLVANQELAALLHAWVIYESPKEDSSNWFNPEARIRHAEAVAQAKLSHAFGVEDFAKAAGIPRAQFSRLYQEHRGMTPGKALREMRMTAAEHLLAHTTLSVQQVGHQVGYPNATVLARCFRERHGMSPSEWRARLLES